MALGYVETLRNNQLDEITAQIGTNGTIRIFSGTRPATGGAETTLLAELALSSTAAGAASGGDLTFSAISDEDSAVADGTASWFRVATSADAAVIDGDVGTSGSDLNLNSTSITTGGTVSITSFVITAGNA
jgi:hypothetical protein